MVILVVIFIDIFNFSVILSRISACYLCIDCHIIIICVITTSNDALLRISVYGIGMYHDGFFSDNFVLSQ